MLILQAFQGFRGFSLYNWEKLMTGIEPIVFGFKMLILSHSSNLTTNLLLILFLLQSYVIKNPHSKKEQGFVFKGKRDSLTLYYSLTLKERVNLAFNFPFSAKKLSMRIHIYLGCACFSDWEHIWMFLLHNIIFFL